MERKSLFRFFVRSLLQLCAFLLGQLPRAMGARIDSTIFLSAFSFIDTDGKRYSLGPWVGAEDGVVVDTPCQDKSGWGRDVPSSPLDTEGSQAADIQSDATERVSHVASNQQPEDELQNGVEHVVAARHGRWNQWFDHLELQSKFIPTQWELFEMNGDGKTQFDLIRNQFYAGPGKPLRIKSKTVTKSEFFELSSFILFY